VRLFVLSASVSTRAKYRPTHDADVAHEIRSGTVSKPPSTSGKQSTLINAAFVISMHLGVDGRLPQSVPGGDINQLYEAV
jgi:hypothetical protein